LREEFIPMIALRDIRVRYGTVEALAGVSLDIPTSTCVVLLGPNGAGKTTLLKVIATLIRSQSGSARIDGEDCTTDPELVRKKLCYIPQDRAVDVLLNVRDNLRLSAMLNGVPLAERERRVDETLSILGLSAKGKANLFQLSGGQVRRVQLARVFLSDAPCLLLDEPTIGVDPKGKHEIWSLIKSRARETGNTVLVATNDMTEAEALGDQIVFLGSGKVVASGSATEIKGLVSRHKRLRIQCSEPYIGLWPVDRNADFGISDVTIRNDIVDLVLSERSINVAKIIELCADLGIDIVDISTPELTLDEVFMHFAGGDIK
jgi:ABC-2 type transport system ATP-binding protein